MTFPEFSQARTWFFDDLAANNTRDQWKNWLHKNIL